MVFSMTFSFDILVYGLHWSEGKFTYSSTPATGILQLQTKCVDDCSYDLHINIFLAVRSGTCFKKCQISGSCCPPPCSLLGDVAILHLAASCREQLHDDLLLPRSRLFAAMNRTVAQAAAGQPGTQTLL